MRHDTTDNNGPKTQHTQRPTSGPREERRFPPRLLIVRAPLTQEQRNIRCDELAKLRGATEYSARLRHIARDRRGDILRFWFEVQSASDSTLFYRVDFFAAMGNAYCACPAGANEQPCWHAGAARLSGFARLAILDYEASPEGRAEAEEQRRADDAKSRWLDEMYSEREGW